MSVLRTNGPLVSDTTTKFDYVISSPMTCIDSLAYTGYQLLDGTAISVSLWVRHSVLGRPGTILSLYGATSRWACFAFSKNVVVAFFLIISFMI